MLNFSKKKGFTLVELLVAIAILAVISVLSWRGLDSIFRSRDALSQDLDFLRGMQTLFRQIDVDVRSASRDTNATTELPGIEFDDTDMTVLRYQFSDGITASAGTWKIVRYSLEDGQIKRRSITLDDPNNLRYWKTSQAWSSVEPQILLKRVRSLSWDIGDANGFGSATPLSVQQIGSAQILGNIGQQNKLGIALKLDLDSGENFRREWIVRE